MKTKHVWPDGHFSRCTVDVTDRNGHPLEQRFISGPSYISTFDERGQLLNNVLQRYGKHNVYVFFNWHTVEN